VHRAWLAAQTARPKAAHITWIIKLACRRSPCAKPVLANLDVQSRVAMQVLRRARFSITIEIYTQASSTATREALKCLGKRLVVSRSRTSPLYEYQRAISIDGNGF
jgi:hypothetical protein